MAYPYKCPGEDVQGKPPDEFDAGEGHFTLVGLIPVILVSEPYLAVFDRLDAVVADGYFMGVPAKVFYHA